MVNGFAETGSSKVLKCRNWVFKSLKENCKLRKLVLKSFVMRKLGLLFSSKPSIFPLVKFYELSFITQ